ncbi:MAG: class I SAM-dependent methyltransferase [Gammaproteobacteria bacterium]|nr:class I SAM-dependent methyltransferase [Gammaproteobacteria bacterium]
MNKLIHTEQQVIKNSYGYYELAHKPSQAELDDYYRNKYYQDSRGSYEHSYSDEELLYSSNKLQQKKLILDELFQGDDMASRSMLDIGCGEGWTLEFFSSLNWQVKGVDFSPHGLHTHNKHLLKFIETGDIYLKLQEFIDSSQRYDLVVLDNVLEHVLEPARLLHMISMLITKAGVLLIEVPNDFSKVQELLQEQNCINRPFWVAVPDHISYFNKNALQLLAESQGWKMSKCLADHPIDMNLFNPDSNYVMDGSKGKNCHRSRVAIENLLHDISPAKTNHFYEAMADLGIGRQIIMFLQPNNG